MSANNCVVLLIDESSAMSAVMRDKLPDGTESTKTNAERIATSINSLLKQLSGGPTCDIALVGYRSDSQGQADVGCRWAGSLAGRGFVPSNELANAATFEQRLRRVPRPDGSLGEETVEFAVWYTPALGPKAPQIAAFKYCRDLISRWRDTQGSAAGQPLVIHVFSGASGDGNPQAAIEELLRLDGGGGKPFVVQCHIAASSALVTSAFPSKQAYLASGLARDLFARASELSQPMRQAVTTLRGVVQPAARALVHNAKMLDVIRCMELAKCHVSGNTGSATPKAAMPQAPTVAPQSTSDSLGAAVAVPAPAMPDAPAQESPASQAGTHAGEQAGLVVLVLDRSVTDPYAGSLSNSCSRLQEAANEILKDVSTKKCAGLSIDTAIVSYGAGSDGQPDVRATFDGPLAGKSIVRNSELVDAAIRVEESECEVSNGVGGLVKIKKKTPIYFDLEPTGTAAPQAAFAAAAGIISEWCGQHPSGLPPILLHLTRGQHAPGDIESAVSAVATLSTSAGPVLINHLVVTEVPCKSAAFPATDADLDGDSLRALWGVSSPLPCWESLAASKRPYISATSRGLVVNGKFDVIAEALVNSLAPA